MEGCMTSRAVQSLALTLHLCSSARPLSLLIVSSFPSPFSYVHLADLCPKQNLPMISHFLKSLLSLQPLKTCRPPLRAFLRLLRTSFVQLYTLSMMQLARVFRLPGHRRRD